MNNFAGMSHMNACFWRVAISQSENGDILFYQQIIESKNYTKNTVPVQSMGP